jgi:curved DNA-binding protein CbpA
MTLYEEVGLQPDATAEQVREAYHAFVRLLHPDQHRDPKLRTLAELQMVRINRTFEVLTDERRRAEYDRSLRQLGHPLAASPGRAAVYASLPMERDWISEVRRVFAGKRISLILGSVAIGAVFLWLGRGHPPVKSGRTEPVPPAAAAAVPPSSTPGRAPSREDKEITALRRQLRELERELSRVRQDLASPAPGRPASLADLPLAPVTPVSRLPASPPAPARGVPSPKVLESVPTPAKSATTEAGGPPRGLAGSWIWIPSAQRGRFSGSYPPEYIELVVKERDQEITGRYRARYRVSDRAISPEVQFEFEGHAGQLRWRGNAGAQGDVRMELRSESELEIHWITTEPGTSPALTSGSATLVRRQSSQN